MCLTRQKIQIFLLQSSKYYVDKNRFNSDAEFTYSDRETSVSANTAKYYATKTGNKNCIQTAYATIIMHYL